MTAKTSERKFQDEVIAALLSNGWLLGEPSKYNRELALYAEDLVGFVKDTQDAQWQKYCKLYPNDPEGALLKRVASQLNKVDPNAANTEMRTFGTLGCLRHEIKDRGARFKLCQFKPEHGLNPKTLARYQKNRLRVVPELVYSPWAAKDATKSPQPHEGETKAEVNVTPAKAGVQSVPDSQCFLDSRLRGNECAHEGALTAW